MPLGGFVPLSEQFGQPQEPTGGSPGPLAQGRPQKLASFDRKWEPARSLLMQQGIPESVWAPIMEIDLQRASKGQNVLSANETLLALRAAMTKDAQMERPQGSLLTRSIRDIRQVVSAVPQLPAMFLHEIPQLPKAPEVLAENVAQGDIAGAFTETPGLRMVPGAYTVSNLASGKSPLDHPVLSLLDVSPFISKGLSVLPKTKAATEALRAEGELLKSTPYRTTVREYITKPREARYEARTGRPYEGLLTKLGLSGRHQGRVAKEVAVAGRTATAAREEFIGRINAISERRKIAADRVPIIYDAARTGRLGEITPNEAAYVEEMRAEIERLAVQEGVPAYQISKGKEGLIQVDGEWYDARSGIGQKVTQIDKKAASKTKAIETLRPKVAGIRHGQRYAEDMIEGNPYWDPETQTFSTPDGRIQSVPIEDIVNSWAESQMYPQRGTEALGKMVDEFGPEGARLQIIKMHDDLLKQSTDDVVAGEIKQEILDAGEKVVFRGKPAPQFLDIKALDYHDVTSPQRALIDAVQGMGPINVALQDALGRPQPLKSVTWDVPEGAGAADTPMFKIGKDGNWEATPEFFENRAEVRARLVDNLDAIPDKDFAEAIGAKRGDVAKRRLLETFDSVRLSTDDVAIRAVEALRNRLYRNKKSRAKVVEGYIERGQIKKAGEKALDEAAKIESDLQKIVGTLFEETPERGPASTYPVAHTTSTLDYGTGAPVLRMEIRDPTAGPSGELNFAGADQSVIGFLDYSPDLRRPGETYVHFITARPEYRGNGVARAMADELYKVTGDAKIDWGSIEDPAVEVLRRRMIEEHPERGNYGKPERGITKEAIDYEKKVKAEKARRTEARSDTAMLIRQTYEPEIAKWRARGEELSEIGDFLEQRRLYVDKSTQLPIQEGALADRIGEQEELLALRQEILQRTPPAAWDPLVQETARRLLKEKHADKYAEGGSVMTKLEEAGEAPPEVDWADVTIRLEEQVPPNIPGLSRSEVNSVINEARQTWMELREVSDHPPVFTHSVSEDQAATLGRPMRSMIRQEVPVTAWKGKTIDPSPTVKSLEIAVMHQGQEIIQQVMDRQIRDWMVNESGWVKPGRQVFAEYEQRARRMIESGVDLRPGTTPGSLADTLIQADMTIWDPKSLTPLTRGHLTRANLENALYVPKWLDKAMNDMYPVSRSALGEGLSKAHNVFRLSILPLSPRWHINNIIGGAVMLMAEGGPGAFRHWSAARKLLKSGELPDEIARGAGNVQAADAAWSLQTGRELGKIWENEQFRKIQEAKTGIQKGFRRATDTSFEMGEYVDKFYRSLAFLEGKSKGERLGLSPAKARNAGVELANRVLQDWDAMTPVERSVIRMVFPFYGWMKHIMRYTFGLAVDHPVRTAILSNFARNEIEDWGTGIPERFMQMFTIGKPDEFGNIKAVNVRGTNPFSDVANYMTLAGFVGQLSPVAGGFLEAMGINSATGTANLYPDTVYNEVLGRNIAKTGNPFTSIARNVIPQFDFVMDQLGMTPAELKNLKEQDPDLYTQRIFSSIGIPFVPKEINLQREAALAEIARNDDAVNAMNRALRSGDWSEAMQYPEIRPLLMALQSMPKSAIEPFLIGEKPKLAS